MDEQLFISKLDTNSVDDIKSYIENESDLKVFQEGSMRFGNSFSSVDLTLLSKWFLHRKKQIGSKQVFDDLKKFLSSSWLPGIDILAITGIRVDRKIDLANDISLIPYCQLPDSFAKAVFNRYSISENFCKDLKEQGFGFLFPIKICHSEILPTAALIVNNSSQRQFIKFGEKPNLSGYESKYKDLLDVCNCLTLMGPSAPMPFMHWWEAEDWIPYSRLFDYSSIGEVGDLINRKEYEWTEEDIKKAPNLVKSYLNLANKEKLRLYIPLERLNKSLCRINLEDRAIELGIVVEALFLNKNEKDKLTYKIKQRAGSFLGIKEAELFVDVYKCRSKAVHTGTLPEKVSGRAPSEIIDEGSKKTVYTIEIIIEKGWPKWEKEGGRCLRLREYLDCLGKIFK